MGEALLFIVSVLVLIASEILKILALWSERR